MTHYVQHNDFPTKKSFREAVAKKEGKVYVTDPAVVNPCSGWLSNVLGSQGHITVTNHPRRQWFASVYRNRRGEIVVE